MKKLFVLSVSIVFLSLQLKAQVGVSVGYVNFDTPEWNSRITNNTSFSDDYSLLGQNGFQYAIDYWFRLKNKRIEFLPEIGYYQFKGAVSSDILPDNAFAVDMTASFFQLHFNTQIYPFDFDGDCDCPTFSKDGDVFKKGLFIRLAPGLSYGNFKEERTNVGITGATSTVSKDTGIAPSFRVGVGLDIGVSDFFTITPIVQYTHTLETGGFGVLTTEVSSTSGSIRSSSEITQLYFGIRLGFRFDELNKYGYR